MVIILICNYNSEFKPALTKRTNVASVSFSVNFVVMYYANKGEQNSKNLC